MKDNKSAKLYISDQTESNDIARRMGEVQVLEADGSKAENYRSGDYEKSGEKNERYYKRAKDKGIKEKIAKKMK